MEQTTDQPKCFECNEKASFFHSKCCMAHMEGVITEKGELQVVCENCKKYVGTLVNPRKDITPKDAKMLIKYLNWLEDTSKVHEKLRSKDQIVAERVSNVVNVLEKLINIAKKSVQTEKDPKR